MVLLLLQIKAELENVTNLEAKGGSDGSEFTFFFKVVGRVVQSGELQKIPRYERSFHKSWVQERHVPAHIKCGGCSSVTEKYSSVTASELYDIPKSRGSANLVQKCKFCDKVGTIAIVEGRSKPYTTEDSEARKFSPIGCFDCRGIEPVDFSLRDGWTAEATSGAKFVDIDLSEGEWSEYDEKASVSVGILNVEHKFVVTR